MLGPIILKIGPKGARTHSRNQLKGFIKILSSAEAGENRNFVHR